MEAVVASHELSTADSVVVLVNPAAPLRASFGDPKPSDFIILRVIGRGAYGKVLQVAHAISGRVYAMKVYSKAVLASQRQLVYTESEKTIMSRLHHPYIVALRYAFQTRTRLFLLSDYCAGGEMFNTLRKHGLLQEDAARVYLGQLVLALEHMHSEGVIHRDIKPENILLDSEGHVAVTDFGLSKDFKGALDSARTHSLVGTDEYLAPEMILNSRWWAAQCATAALERKEKAAAEEFAAAVARAKEGNAAVLPDPPQPTSAEEREAEVKAANASASKMPGYNRSVDLWALGTLAYEMLTGECLCPPSPCSLPPAPPPLPPLTPHTHPTPLETTTTTNKQKNRRGALPRQEPKGAVQKNPH
jgi:serine/threonine protein kinase